MGQPKDMSTEIYYFSGTGNSMVVARDLAAKTNGKLISIPAVMDQDIIKPNAGALGIVSPTYYMRMPGIVGRFVGKLADLVVWNKDIRTLGERVPVTAVQDMKPVMTLIDGRIAYQDAAAGIKIERA